MYAAPLRVQVWLCRSRRAEGKTTLLATQWTLTPDKEALLAELYAQDVKYWNWTQWAKLADKTGQVSMGLTWVLLPFKPEAGMPILRRRCNELYLQAMRDNAQEYGFKIRIEEERNMLVLYDESIPDLLPIAEHVAAIKARSQAEA